MSSVVQIVFLGGDINGGKIIRMMKHTYKYIDIDIYLKSVK